jgi:hypothetical protein
MCSCQRTLEFTGRKLLCAQDFQKCFQVVSLAVRHLYRIAIEMVGLTGVEPVTLRLSSACSNQLSYRPYSECEAITSIRNFPRLVELRRVELLTYSLQSYRSTN